MKNIVKNAAIAAIIAASTNSAFAEEVSSMYSATTSSVAFEVGNVLNGRDSNSNIMKNDDLLFVDAQTLEYINATDLYDKPSKILGVYKEEVGLPQELSIDVDQKVKVHFDSLFNNEINQHLTREDFKRFAVLKEVAKQFSLTYETGLEILQQSGGYENLGNRDKAFLYQNETEANCAALVLFERSLSSNDKENKQSMLSELTKLLSTSKDEFSSSLDAMKDTVLSIAMDNTGNTQERELTNLNVRDLTRAIAIEHRTEGKKYLAQLNSVLSDNELIAGLKF